MKLLRFFVCKVYGPITVFYFSEHVIPSLTPSKVAHIPEKEQNTFYSRSTYKTSAKCLEVVLQTFKQAFPH